MKQYFHEKYINNQLDQVMTVDFNGYNYDVKRVDGTGYSTRLNLNTEECVKFTESLINHGWEKVDGYRGVQVSDNGQSRKRGKGVLRAPKRKASW